jgi:hypothetical protein
MGGRLSLPHQRMIQTWAGQGSGASCDLCGHPIGTHEIEYEVKAQSPVQVLRFHLTCYRQWRVNPKSVSPG